MNHFPQNLANYRRSKRIRSHQACELLQLSRAALKAYEKGECMPTPEMLCKNKEQSDLIKKMMTSVDLGKMIYIDPS